MPNPDPDSAAYDVVVVNYQSTDLLLELLSDFKGLANPPAAVYVVDNASKDEPRRILKKHPGVNLILSKNKPGLWPGRQFRLAQGEIPPGAFHQPRRPASG
jgi:hypothetical protein